MTQATMADRLLEKVGGVCLIAAPLLMAICSFLWFNDSLLLGAGIVQMYASVLYIPAILVLARLMWHQAPRLAVFVGMLGILGCAGAINFGTFGAYQWAAGTAGADAATVRAIEQVADEQLFPVLNLPGIVFPLALLILSIGLFRTGVVPRWMALLIGIGAICFPLSRIPDIRLLFHVSDLLLLVPLGWIGLRQLIEVAPGKATVPAAA